MFSGWLFNVWKITRISLSFPKGDPRLGVIFAVTGYLYAGAWGALRAGLAAVRGPMSRPGQRSRLRGAIREMTGRQ